MIKTSLTSNHTSVLEQYGKAIAHMRQQYQNKRFGLVFGSGISKDFDLPDWQDLIKKIAYNSEVTGSEILKYCKDKSPILTAQMLYEHYKLQNADIDEQSKLGEGLIRKRWIEIIHQELWKDFNLNGKKNLRVGHHPYIESYLPIIKKTPITVNYNFDNILQTLIELRRTEQELENGSKLFETVHDEKLQFQLNEGVIYHPNGFLPRNLAEGPSEHLIFSEDSFADNLIASMSGRYSTLIHHFSKHTCLLIGLSLEDSVLKHLLRQSAITNPGHYHYYINYSEPKSDLTKKQEDSLRETNFNLYNLITLSLNNKQLKALGELIYRDDKIFQDYAGTRKFVYYLTGPVGAGKSTTLSYFRNLTTYAEWPEQRIPLLVENSLQLKPREKKEVDSWIYQKFFLKNQELTKEEEGLLLVDRTPLDPFTFEKKNNWSTKADELDKAITKKNNRIAKGLIIFLKAEPNVIAMRLQLRTKPADYKQNDIERMYNDYQLLFENISEFVIPVETKDLSPHEVAKKVARIIHMDDYKEGDLHSVIDFWKNKTV